MPKPNTRFLRHIIKDTDSHNKALLAKEAAESRARLGNLEQVAEDKRLRTNPNAKDIRKRQMGDIHAILGGGRKRRREDDGATGKDARVDDERRQAGRRDHHRRDRDRSTDDLIDTKRCSKHRGRLADHRDDSDHERRRSRKSLKSDDPREDERHRRRRDRDRSRSPRRRRSSSREKTRSRRHERSPLRERTSPKRTVKERQREDDADSDPLEDLIGPMPAPRYRGRGTVAGSSGIDRRFSESYDPSTDVAMPDEDAWGSTWDDAVEAFRDRQKLRQAQEERMRSAGFGDDQISRLSGRAGAAAAVEEGDVKWSKAGEKREWDLGKETGVHPAGILGEFSDA